MKNIFKLIFLFSLIINALSADSCSSITDSGQCKDDCKWVAAVTKACEAIENVMTEGCAAKTVEEDCPKIKSGNTAVCAWDATKTPKCEPVTADISSLCSAADTDVSTCTGVKSGDTVLCEFTPASPAKCVTKPVTFTGAITIKLKSVKGKAVVITLEPAAADKEKKVTAETAIKNLQLTGTSFTKDLTCKIASGSKLGDVDCTMDTAATKDTKYKLIEKSGSKVSFDGEDEFEGAITVDATEVTATEDASPSGSPDNNSSSYMKISALFTFLFLLF
jgi:hypothetical protein